jgi:hypothetical protein
MRWHILWIGQVSDQPMSLSRSWAMWVIVGILNDAHEEAAHIPASIGLARVDLGEVRTIMQTTDRP